MTVTRPHLRWACLGLASLVIGRFTATETVTAAVGIAVVVVVLVIAVVTLGAAFGKTAERRQRACGLFRRCYDWLLGRTGGDGEMPSGGRQPPRP